jgi:hypothetical protein
MCKTVLAVAAALGILWLVKVGLDGDAPSAKRLAVASEHSSPSVPRSTPCPKTMCDTHATGNLDCRTGTTRKYELPMCKLSYTIPELNYDFAAHQVEWNIMGKTSAF